jgi:hypothetical protein
MNIMKIITQIETPLKNPCEQMQIEKNRPYKSICNLDCNTTDTIFLVHTNYIDIIVEQLSHNHICKFYSYASTTLSAHDVKIQWKIDRVLYMVTIIHMA